jgi:hypothetical protein
MPGYEENVISEPGIKFGSFNFTKTKKEELIDIKNVFLLSNFMNEIGYRLLPMSLK